MDSRICLQVEISVAVVGKGGRLPGRVVEVYVGSRPGMEKVLCLLMMMMMMLVLLLLGSDRRTVVFGQ